MMKLINADELRKQMYHEAFETDTDMQRWDSGCWIRYKMFENALENAPTIEAEPVRHGHWIFTNKPNIYGGRTIKCSECGYEGVVAHIEDHHYCWVCGAKMDAKEVEE